MKLAFWRPIRVVRTNPAVLGRNSTEEVNSTADWERGELVASMNHAVWRVRSGDDSPVFLGIDLNILDNGHNRRAALGGRGRWTWIGFRRRFDGASERVIFFLHLGALVLQSLVELRFAELFDRTAGAIEGTLGCGTIAGK